MPRYLLFKEKRGIFIIPLYQVA